MYCTKCGKENDDSNTFCGYCGSKFVPLNDLPLAVPPEETPSTAETSSPVPAAVKAAGVNSVKKPMAKMILIPALAVVLIAAALVLSGRTSLTEEDGILWGEASAMLSDDLIHGAFCCQVNDRIYYTNPEGQLWGIGLDGTNNSVVFDGEVSSVKSVKEYIYFNGVKVDNSFTYRYFPPADELIRSDISFDCFDIYLDEEIYGTVHSTNGNKVEVSLISCDMAFGNVSKIPIKTMGYGNEDEVKIFADVKICICKDFYLVDTNGKLYYSTNPKKYSSENVSALAHDSYWGDFTVTKLQHASDSALVFYDCKNNSLRTLNCLHYSSSNFDSELITDDLSSGDFTIGESVVFNRNGIKTKGMGYGVQTVMDCEAKNLAMVGDIVYFTRPEDGVLCRVYVDGSGFEKVKISKEPEKPTVKTLYSGRPIYYYYNKIPYISGANNQALKDFNKQMFEVKNETEFLLIHSNYFELGSIRDVRYAAVANDDKIQILYCSDPLYGEFRSYNYDIQAAKWKRKIKFCR